MGSRISYTGTTACGTAQLFARKTAAFTPVEEYIRYLKIMLRELRKQTDKIIFATTTPVRDGSINQKLQYIVERNQAAKALMEQEHVMVNDMYEFVYPHLEQYIGDDKIHLNQTGVDACGARVAEFIRKIDQ